MERKISKAAAKTAGKAKAAGKALEGQTGILRHLAGEHGKVATLMARIASSDEDSDVREDLFPDVKEELLAHAKSEEAEFYPVLREYEEFRDLVEESLEQHRRVEQMLGKLSSGDKSTKTWLDEFESMKRAVEEHVDLEENRIFPRAKEVIPKERLSTMLDRYEQTENSVKEELES